MFIKSKKEAAMPTKTIEYSKIKKNPDI